MTQQQVSAATTAVAPMVVVRNLRRSFGSGARTVHALRGVSFEVRRGELTALKGRSGSGKTTLMNLVGGLDSPTGGTVELDGTDLTGLDESGRLALRRDRIGFVFQSFGLIPVLTAAENVGVPLRMRGSPRNSARSACAPCWPWSVSPTTPDSAPGSCPAVSSSASRWPARWPMSPP